MRFQENNGRQYTYGFYPASQIPDENQRTVAGCVHHPDTTHDACIDDKVTYSLTQDQYNAGLQSAQRICGTGHAYGEHYTCTTFADDVARASGQVLPSSRSEPTKVYYQPVPSIDNPNTLEENVQKERTKLPLGRGQYWNPPATQAARAEVMRANIDDILAWINSQNHRMAFLTLNALNMKEMLDTLDQLASRIDLKSSLVNFLPVAQGVDKPRLTVALRAVDLKSTFVGATSPEQINEILALDPRLPDDQKTTVSAYLGGVTK